MGFVGFTIQLLGGPDDGATFRTWELPPTWEMLKRSKSIACDVLGEAEDKHVDTYWHTADLSERGYVIYEHESLIP